MMAVKLLLKIAVMMMAPATFRRHRKRRGEGGPSSSSLTSSLDGRRVSPLFLGLHGMGGARAPPRLDLSLCLSLFLRSRILPWHRFFYIWRSVASIGMKPSLRSFSKNYLSCGQRSASTALRGAQEGGGTPTWSGRGPLSRGHLGHCLALILLPQNHKYSKIILRPFLSRLDSV